MVNVWAADGSDGLQTWRRQLREGGPRA